MCSFRMTEMFMFRGEKNSCCYETSSTKSEQKLLITWESWGASTPSHTTVYNIRHYICLIIQHSLLIWSSSDDSIHSLQQLVFQILAFVCDRVRFRTHYGLSSTYSRPHRQQAYNWDADRRLAACSPSSDRRSLTCTNRCVAPGEGLVLICTILIAAVVQNCQYLSPVLYTIQVTFFHVLFTQTLLYTDGTRGRPVSRLNKNQQTACKQKSPWERVICLHNTHISN